MNSVQANEQQTPWWKSAVIYQIYPRSFLDTNGDGVGDLRGIIQKLPYIKSLGVDAIWLGPICSSPNDDMGYDVSDYRQIMTEFGTMADFDELMSLAKAAELKVIVDLVLNHSSDEHSWFIESRSSRDNPYRDYYIWRDAKGNGEPSNWESVFSGSTWEFDEASGQYYLHLYSRKQPDLNWENPEVRRELFNVVQFWIDKGVDGFRLDTITTISKAPDFPDAPVVDSTRSRQPATQYYMNGPRMMEYLREFHDVLLSDPALVTIGEAPGATPLQALDLIDSKAGVMDMVIQWEHTEADPGTGGKWGPEWWTVPHFRKIMSAWQRGLAGKGWNTLYLNNHDQPRAVSRFGDDAKYHSESAKMLATCIHLLQGTPFVYQGEEIGMTNVAFASIGDYRCVETLNMYQKERAAGVSDATLMERIHRKSRDNARTPMQWTGKPNGGFTGAKPWIAVNPNYAAINVEKQEDDVLSVLNYYRKLIALRKSNPVIVHGSYADVDTNSDWVYAFKRSRDGTELLCINNFSANDIPFRAPLPSNADSIEVIIGNYEDDYARSVRPFETRVYRYRT
ncbi:alpha-glucosidase [Rhizobium sp. N4311]|uniref:alpha-glucosidase n=1 Tax=Rhizobium sp. N4311 TaxID=1703972 RepID=UPI000B96BA13|nr:alpha-glucosidase [Rhizobium sp. N4311]OYD00388.1 oligo-1,6-glucosidase [Rhizobium sp. N4311]